MAVAQTTVTGTIVDGNRQPVTNATIWFQAISSVSFQPLSYQNGAGNTVIVPPIPAQLNSAGAFSLLLDDTQPTKPANIGYGVTITDNVTGKQLLGVGYGCIQPTGANWDLSLYTPLAQPGMTVVPGPPGPTGPPGDSAYVVLRQAVTAGAVSTWTHGLNTPGPEWDFKVDSATVGNLTLLTFPTNNTAQATFSFSGQVTATFRYVAAFALPGPIHNWPMNEGSGAVLADTGTSPQPLTSPVAFQWLTGIAGYASAIPVWQTQTEKAIAAVANGLGNGPMSFSAWVNVANNHNQTIFSTSPGLPSLKGITFEIAANQTIVSLVSDGPSNVYTAVGAPLIPNATTTQVGFSIDGTGTVAGIKIYINGAPQSMSVLLDTLAGNSVATTAPIVLGSYGDGSQTVFGAVARGKVYNYVISDDQFAAIFAAGAN